MADQARPEQLVVAAAATYALAWPIGPAERETIRTVLEEALPRCGPSQTPAMARVIAAARACMAHGRFDDSTELRLALGNLFYRRIGHLAPEQGGVRA